MISFNITSLPDLCAVIFGSAIALLFLFRAARSGIRNNAEFVFGLQMLFVTLNCAFLFLSDNVVPADQAASSLADSAPQTTLKLFRYMFASGALVLATMTHFSFIFAAYGQKGNGLKPGNGTTFPPESLAYRWKIGLAYGAAIVIAALIVFTPDRFFAKFLTIRNTPLQEEACFSCMVPFQPEYGPLASVYMICWILIVFHAVYILASSKVRAGLMMPARLLHQGRLKKRSVTLGILCWGLAGLISMFQGFHGWSGFDFSVLVVIAGMGLVTMGLI